MSGGKPTFPNLEMFHSGKLPGGFFMRFKRQLLFTAILILVCSSTSGRPTLAQETVSGPARKFVNRQESEKIAEAFREANKAWEKDDYKAAAEILKSAYVINPEDDLIVSFIAESYAIAGDQRASLEWLQKLLAVSPCFFHLPENATSILNSREYKKLAAMAHTRRSPHASKVAFVLPEKDLIPEGIAYDSTDEAFFLSSLHKRKIVRVRPRTNRPPIVEDFTSEGQDGLYSTLGMKVDAAHRVLWVCSSAESFMKGYTEADAGKAALFKYDLTTRKLIRKYELGPTPRHLLNDIVLNAQGDAYLTDIASGEIFTVSHEKDELEVFIPAGTLNSPNGIAISNDGRKLYISDMPVGVYVVDVKTKDSHRLPQRVGISPSGSDGLYFYANSLLGIVNIVSDRAGRVARFSLDSSAESITRGAVLDCNHPLYQWPTTGVIVGDSFFYIANSQFGHFDDKQRSFPKKYLRKVAVMRLRL
jgi:sugar lactone lactonase YvrE